MADSVSPASARRIALAAQGFGRPRPEVVGTRQLNLLIERLGLLQLDSVNVLERSHYLPVFARLGAYDKTLLDRLTFARRGPYREYWAHEAALIPLEHWPLFRFRMQDYRDYFERSGDPWLAAHADTLGWLRSELAEKGPLPASKIERDASAPRRGSWWEWDEVKRGLERMFRVGEVVSAGRSGFERTYALPEQVMPAELSAREVPREEAVHALMERSARAHGIGTLSDLADYYRLKNADAKPALERLVDESVVRRVTVPGWTKPAYLHREARIPRRIEATALLSPFDPVVWERERALRLFGFHYRIEIYTPAPKRVYGYYTLPVLVDDALVGRIDLKNDRKRGVLRVQSAWREQGAPDAVAERIVPALRELAAWQGLGELEVVDRGDLARAVAAEAGVALLPASA
ncbi:winged helix-turn-helix domain-containing protein [Protaetiibacter mangrovi]|uniref:Winged helix DNA-binding domain-containing protein n=1 Tax=Protaetiibacter mangrovi TaxID=2970926 RepID=A0ABT1ZE16_9MICO|nr:crosslink repair DNA glycosylase YcaQ family protein [Protaetiibacter mangrovi]MCS0498926.1 winged helix DNA-binding domain-containing protein [Protaetiibacter mangrovi]TPX05229.1 winged helix-turn-helix domain-containing protein [Schumannella luteola]